LYKFNEYIINNTLIMVSYQYPIPLPSDSKVWSLLI